MGFSAKNLNPGEQIAINVRPHWKFLFLPVLATVVVLAGAIAALIAQIPQWALIAVGVVLLASLGWLFARYLKWTTDVFIVTNERLIMRHGVLRREGREILLDRLTDISCNQTFFDRLLKCGDVLIESPGRDSPETFPDLPHPVSIQNEIYRLIEGRRGAISQGGAGGWVPGPGGGQPGAYPPAPPAGAAYPPSQFPGAPPPQPYVTGGAPSVPGPVATGQGGTFAEGADVQPGLTVAEQLSQLDDLRKRGIISRKEFAAKKAELLSRL
ncbi:MAG TPA: PH domain-containing protein [Acidimicrobiales bacterium]|nr:PH domain-containing protein [Acidimicrobiales bacterium]